VRKTARSEIITPVNYMLLSGISPDLEQLITLSIYKIYNNEIGLEPVIGPNGCGGRIEMVDQQTRMCTGCGRQIPMEYNVCPHCGRPQTVPKFSPQSSNIENDKIMGIIGTLLFLISPLADKWTVILVIIGTVLLLVAFNGLANHYQDRSVFQNVLFGGIIFIVGLGMASIIIMVMAASLISSLGIITDPSVLLSMDLSSLLLSVGLALIVIMASSIVGTIFIRKSLKIVAQKSGTTMFATAGTILFIGSILTIIVIGFVIIWIAMILLLMAFIQMKNEPVHEWRPNM
jgi:uncharacterized membrane protein